MDERSDRGEFYPGGSRSAVPPGTSTDKVDRVSLGEVGESYTLKDVKQKVNQIVRAIAPVTVCLAICAQAATAPLEDLTNTAHVVTNEEDAVAMAAVGALGQAMSNRVEAAEGALQAEIADATNAVVQAALRAAEAESNRVDATYAKRSEIPAAPDLSPYALKSELPQDYLTENDITNFATRAWINSQNYAREGTVYTRLDAQDLAIDAATNWLWAAHLAEAARLNAASNAIAQAHAQDMATLRAADTALSNRLEQARSALDSAWRAGTNAVMQTVGSESNRLDAATNRVWQSALRADETLQLEIDALRIVAADSNAVTRLVTADGTTWQDATGTVWQVQVATSLWTVVHSWTTNDVNWSGPWWWGAEAAGDDYYDGSGWYISSSSLTPMRMSEDPYASEIVVEWTYWGEEEHSVTTRCTRTVQWLTNAVNRVAYTNDVAAAIVQLQNEGTVLNAERLVDTMTGDSVTARDVINATNYTDQVAAEFEDGTRTVMNANNAGSASDAQFAYMLSGDEWSDQYNANDLIRASTNAAKAVVGPATNAVLQAALSAAASKQDALPYPTNAIPYAAISGAPSGGPEWRVEWRILDAGQYVDFVTNGCIHASFGDSVALNYSRAGWPDGAAMFVRATGVPQSYWPYCREGDSSLRLVGYGTWPTNNFQSVWWRSGTNIFVNILLEE